MQKDQRVFERFPARFPAKFKDLSSDYGTDVFLKDASAQGACFTTKQRLFLNDGVSLIVKLPESDHPLTLNGRVVWVKESAPYLWDVGIEFHEIQLMALQRMYHPLRLKPSDFP